MTIIQFNKLRELEQFDILLSFGTIISKRKEGRYKFVLYQVDELYIELKYHKDYKTMPDIRCFTSNCLGLLPYLEQIDLSNMF